MKFVEMDPYVTFAAQLDCDSPGPVVLINRFSVEPSEAEQLLTAWSSDARIMQEQRGFVSTQLHRSVGGGGQFLNYAIWSSIQAFRVAFENPEFRAKLKDYPASTVASPHLFEKVSVTGIC